MSNLAKLSDIRPPSFDDQVIRMTDAQKELISFIKKNAEEGKIINREAILDFYIKNVKGSEYYKRYGSKRHPDPQYTHMITDFEKYTVHKWRDYWNIKTQAVGWFKNNLGGCILKGKLLVLPIIEV